jgi:hypothetical protein
MKFSDLEFEDEIFHRAHMSFPNGYGISVVQLDETEPIYEAAVLKGEDLCYNTDIANDVIPGCTEEQIEHLMERISKL